MYYQMTVCEADIAKTMNALNKRGYQIFNVVPSFQNGQTTFVIIYFYNA